MESMPMMAANGEYVPFELVSIWMRSDSNCRRRARTLGVFRTREPPVVFQCGGERESRVATMCLPTCGDRSVLVPPAMIFRGGGKVSAAMKAQLDVKKASSDVHYTFQAKAWIDEQRLFTWKHADKVRT